MIRPTRVAQLVAVSAAAALVLASCGSDNNNTSTGNTTTPTDSSTPPANASPLVLGALLPQSGDLAFLGPPQFAGVQLAVDDINAAGGVLGNPVKLVKADEGDGTPDVASGSADKLLNAGVSGVIGAAASTITLAVIDKFVGAGVVEMSGSNTSPALDTYDDKGLYFRTAPSDALQGSVLGNLIVQDGFKNVAILARQDSYGEGLAKQLATTLEEQGATVAADELYSADATNYTAEINKIAAAQPDALALISFAEAKKIIPGLIAKGIGPQDIQLYLVDGDTADYSKDFAPGTLAGTKATFPSAPEADPSFQKALLKINPKLKDFTYAPQVYDAAVMMALAATAAKDTSGEGIASQMIAVSKDGTKCSTYADCVALLDQGEDIDYDGKSGPVDLNDSGSVSKATIGIQLYANNNTYKEVDSVTGVLN